MDLDSGHPFRCLNWWKRNLISAKTTEWKLIKIFFENVAFFRLLKNVQCLYRWEKETPHFRHWWVKFVQKYTFEEKYFKITLETIQTLVSLGTGAFGGELGGEKKLAKLREASPNCQPISQFFWTFWRKILYKSLYKIHLWGKNYFKIWMQNFKICKI